MSGKMKGLLTVSGEWVRHLRPYGRRLFWSSERKAAQHYIAAEIDAANKPDPSSEKMRQEKVEMPNTSLKADVPVGPRP